jgi:transposase
MKGQKRTPLSAGNPLVERRIIDELQRKHRKALIELIRKTKDIVRDLDNLQYRKIKKLIKFEKNDGCENSVIEDNSQIDVKI